MNSRLCSAAAFLCAIHGGAAAADAVARVHAHRPQRTGAHQRSAGFAQRPLRGVRAARNRLRSQSRPQRPVAGRPRSRRRRNRAASRNTPPTTPIRAGRRTAPASTSCPRAPAPRRSGVCRMLGGEAVQITDYPLDVSTFKFSAAAGASRSAMDVFPDCADLKCTRARLDAAAASKVSARTYRQPVRASLGHLARSHALESVRGAGASRRPRRHAGEREPARWRPTCLPSPTAATRNSPSRPTASAWCSARASRAARKPWSTNFDLYEAPVGRQRGAEESHRRQSGLGHAAGVPEEWRPRLAGDEAARLRGRPLRHQAAPWRRGARRRRAAGTAPSRIST